MLKKIFLILFTIVFLIILFPTGMILENNKSDEEILISKALSTKKISLFSLSLHRNVFNQIKGKPADYNLFNVDFLSSKKLLEKKITKFYSVDVKIKKNHAVVIISYYRAGILFTFNYKKENEKWVEIKNDWGRVKFEPTKAYFIYLENMRLSDTKYKNYNIKMIPRDSLR